MISHLRKSRSLSSPGLDLFGSFCGNGKKNETNYGTPRPLVQTKAPSTSCVSKFQHEPKPRASEGLDVMNMQGRILISLPVIGAAGTLSLDIAKLPEAVYVVFLRENNTIIAQEKLIVKP